MENLDIKKLKKPWYIPYNLAIIIFSYNFGFWLESFWKYRIWYMVDYLLHFITYLYNHNILSSSYTMRVVPVRQNFDPFMASMERKFKWCWYGCIAQKVMMPYLRQKFYYRTKVYTEYRQTFLFHAFLMSYQSFATYISF